MSPILVIGRNGELARSLAERASAAGVPLANAGRPDLDLSDLKAIRSTIAATGARTVVNAAAYTAVDQAEDEPELAAALNVDLPRRLAEAAKPEGARLVHISTDYVFDGSGDRPWTESDRPAPASVYGRTKLEGEYAVRQALPDAHAILRTAWLYSPFGKNFVETMLDLARHRAEIQVVGDQVGNPTSAFDVADAILAMTRKWETDPEAGLGSVYHVAGSGETSWAGFAREIFSISATLGGPTASVMAIPTADWPAKAARPQNGRLDCSAFERTFGYRAPPWQGSLKPVVERLLQSDGR